MSFTDFVYGLGDFLEGSFTILEMLGNIPNVIAITLGFAGIGLWLKMQSDFNKKAERDGSLK